MARCGKWIEVRDWKAGRVWQAADGTRTYYIRRQVGGRLYEVSTRCTSRRAAEKQLDRFEADPEHYDPSGDDGRPPIYLDEDHVKAFLRWSKHEKGNTPAWTTKQKAELKWWAERLPGVDLRGDPRGDLLRDRIVPALEGASDRAKRIAVLKTFYSWLLKVRHEITAAEDPTFRALSAPPSRPAQHTRSKVVPREHYLLVRDHLRAEEEGRQAARDERRKHRVVPLAPPEEERDGPWADALTVQAGTGWHTTEVVRFAAGGTIEPLPPSMKVEHGAVAVLVCPLHKSGDTHRTAVSAEVLEAGKRLREHGAFSREWYDRLIRSTCAKVKRPDGEVGIPVFTPARLRHSTATWAIEAGADPFAVSAFLGHKSVTTTKKFYATLATVPKVPTLA